MTIEYILLLFANILCFCRKISKSVFLLICSVVAAYIYGTIDFYGISTVIGLYAITYVYFQRDIDSKTVKIILLLIILATVMLLSFHLLPGFNNPIVIDRRKISELSTPYSMYLNFDKTIAGIILFMNSRLYENEKLLDIKSIITTAMLLLLCSTILMSAGLLSGYIEFDYKIPDVLLLWCINNLFFTCFSEEVIFRGIIHNKLEQLLQRKYLALMLSSLIFGLAHFTGGLAYILLASIAGAFYGLTYQKTGRILCTILVHFGFNLIHLIFFTYPAASKIIS